MDTPKRHLRRMLASLLVAAVATLVTSCAGYNGLEDDDATTASYAPPRQEAIIQYELNSVDQEITVLQQRMHRMEATIDALREDIASGTLRTSSTSKAATATKALETEMQTLKKQTNTLTKSLEKSQAQLERLCANTDSNTDNLGKLDNALRSLMDAVHQDLHLQGSAPVAEMSVPAGHHTKVYHVKSGDTLEKIAKEHGTSVQAVKDLNNLQREDFILVGQQLLIP